MATHGTWNDWNTHRSTLGDLTSRLFSVICVKGVLSISPLVCLITDSKLSHSNYLFSFVPSTTRSLTSSTLHPKRSLCPKSRDLSLVNPLCRSWIRCYCTVTRTPHVDLEEESQHRCALSCVVLPRNYSRSVTLLSRVVSETITLETFKEGLPIKLYRSRTVIQ